VLASTLWNTTAAESAPTARAASAPSTQRLAWQRAIRARSSIATATQTIG
jgi:hypothetical protein